MSGVYIHIPFCDSKCDYCDFLSFANQQNAWVGYKSSVINELARFEPKEKIDTIYIGGGTPTIWHADFLAELLQACPAPMNNAEITCEANPGTLTSAKIATLKAGGVNRISLGLQAWQPRLLKALNRRATHEDFTENFNALRQVGFNNINVDIMFAIPGQTVQEWEETLQKVVDLQPEHISAYACTLEEKTPLWDRVQSAAIKQLDDETDRRMYHYAKLFLHENGYSQYELSNFCKPGMESRHNTKYWTRQPYRGFGLGAHSFENNARWHNTLDLQQYIKWDVQERFELAKISNAEAMSETIFLGLRLTKGLLESNFAKVFGCYPSEVYGDWIRQMKSEEMLATQDGYMFLTDLGMDFANKVMRGFM
ncbi:MAG: radical SAM family heme chaperone HemW [Defluviitaleaceae bacterium]|nr:radical SAM family heme chaperone HemW [Defluviitaleaceae bacterium]